MRTEIIKYVIFTPLLILGAMYGMTVLIAGIIVFFWLGFMINAMYSKKLIDLSILSQSLSFLPVMGISAVASLLTWLVGIFFALPLIVLFAIQILLYPSLILVFSIVFKVAAFIEVKQILMNKFTIANFVKTINKSK
jgi:hypothetical protein